MQKRCLLYGFTLAFLCITPAFLHGQTVIHQDSDTNGNCEHFPKQKAWPAPEPGAVTLHQRQPVNPQKDTSTTSSFDAWRSFQPGEMVDLAVCYGTVRVVPVSQSNKLHLTITLHSEMPKGKTVGDYIQQFDTDPKQAEIFIKVPKKYHAEVTLQVPEVTMFDAGLGSGSLDFQEVMGNKDLGVGKGDVLLHGNIEREYSSMDAGFGIGGVRDTRPGGKNHGHFATGWEESGTGRYKLDIGIGWGHVYLLPETN